MAADLSKLQSVLNSMGATGVSAQDFVNALSSAGLGINNNRFSGSRTHRTTEYQYRADEYLKDSPFDKLAEKRAKNAKALKEMREEMAALRQEAADLNQEISDALARGEDVEDRRKQLSSLNDEINNLGSETSRAESDMNSRAGGILDVAKAFVNAIQTTGREINNIYKTLQDWNQPWAKVDESASKFAKHIGMAAQGMKNLRDNAIDNVVKNHIAIDYNVSPEELIQLQENYAKGIGRNVRLSTDDQINMAAMSSVLGPETANELAVAFEHFGVNMSDSGKHVGKMFDQASRTGISVDKLSNNIKQNMTMVQNYTFKDGIKGFENMAKKSAALKLDMQQVAGFAEKLANGNGGIEAAIDSAAKLQVLGGPFAQMADPLGMLNEGLNDVEALQDRVANMVKGMGYFDKKTGEVKVEAQNKLRIRAAAEAMGMDYTKLMESVTQQAKRGAINNAIQSSSKARGYDDDMKELLMNTATFKDGKAGVSIDGEWKSIEDLNKDDFDALIAETRSESDDIKQIAKDLRSLVDIRSGAKKQTDALQAKASFGEIAKKVTSWFGHINLLLGGIVAARGLGAITNILGSGINIIGAWKGITKAFTGGMKSSPMSILSKFGTAKGATGGSAVKGVMSGLGGGATKGTMGRLGDVMSKFRGTRFGGMIGGTPMAGAGPMKGGTKMGGMLGRMFGKNMGHSAEVIARAKNIKDIKNAAEIAKTAKAAANTAKAGKAALDVGKLLKGGGLGIVGAAGNMLTDHLVDKGKIKKGGTAHTAMTTASTAAEWAAMGSFLGPWGTAIGAAIGAGIGLHKAAKARSEVALDNQLEKRGIQRQGKYTKKQLDKIESAINNGEMSDKLRKKLAREGDFAIIDEINKKKSELEASGKKDEKDKKSKKENIEKAIEKANFKIGYATFEGIGPSTPGISAGDKKVATFAAKTLATPYTVGKNSVKALSNTVKIIKGHKEDGLGSTFEKVIPTNNGSETVAKNSNTNEATNRDFNININGSLKLTSDNGTSIDIISELRKSPILLQQLSAMIANEIGTINRGGYVPQDSNGIRGNGPYRTA